MLIQLNIKNYILIDNLSVNFNDNLNIFTGETGAGKSIIIDAISIGLGKKINKNIIKDGAEKALIQLVFDIDDLIKDNFKDYDILENQIIITREITKNRSIFKINDQIVSLKVLNELSSYLIDIHGQHEHQGLLNEKNHIKYIDMYLDDEHKNMINEINELYLEIKKLNNELYEMKNTSNDVDLDYLLFQINEIKELNIDIESDKELENEYKYYKNIVEIHRSLNSCINILSSDNDYNISLLFDNVLNAMKDFSEFNSDIDSCHKQAESIKYDIDDLKSNLINIVENIDLDDEKLIEIENRINIINRLKLKHKCDLDMLLVKLDELTNTYNNINNLEENIINLENKINSLLNKYYKYADIISERRINISKKIEALITEQINELNMKNSKFHIEVNKKDISNNKIYNDGTDEVRFLIDTNNFGFYPLKDIASGGELSRVMLSLKIILSDKYNKSLIFDEIDSGISGQTAVIVGQKIKKLSFCNQIILITHLPQIASLSDKHFTIYKEIVSGETKLNLKVLNKDEKEYEIARLISGDNITEKSLENAKELIGE